MGGDGIGSSPQARGTHQGGPRGHGDCRFIPAGAGNTKIDGANSTAHPVHPRRRGEHAPLQPPVASSHGSSPQARGTPPPHCCRIDNSRFIPAGAGNTGRMWARLPEVAVHPRRRGEHVGGLVEGDEIDRFIPAGAGNTSGAQGRARARSVHPRRRGEHGSPETEELINTGSSPQARGTPKKRVRRSDVLRFIPAGAGNTLIILD